MSSRIESPDELTFGCGEMVVEVEFSNEKDEVICCFS